MVSDLVSLLPKRDTALLLVDNYFAKIHWFTLLFHQRHFRQRTHALYPTSNRPILVYEATDESTIGFTSVLLAVFSLSLRYLDPGQQQLLATRGINADQLREHILMTLKLRILDILALGSLEAVQLCVLLNSFYLYHGQPETAWPLCGCGLRLAQALELHRHPSHTRNNFSQQEIEDRKRCWWALHEAETYCSMVYGFPLSFSDAKCDADSLDPRDPWSIGADSQATATNGPTLLEYKCAMSALAIIVRSTLEELYEPCQGQSTQQGPTTQSQLLEKVQTLYNRLHEWYTKLPKELQMEQLSGSSASPRNNRVSASRLSDLPFEQKLFHLQALSLKLAYENAKILTYRPLLSGRIDSSPEVVTTCLNAALQISWAGHVPIFQEAATTYALNSIALHLLTAGIVLCVVASTGPLTANAFQAKLGIHRLLEMQVSLKNNSIMAEQGLQILKTLLSRVMQRETAFMLRTDPDHREKTPAEAQGNQNRQSVPVQPIQADSEQRIWDSTGPLQALATASEATALGAAGGSLMPNPAEDFSATQIMQDIEEGNTRQYITSHPVTLTTIICKIIAFRYSDSFMITDENDEPNPYKSSAVSQDQGWIWDAQLGFDTFL